MNSEELRFINNLSIMIGCGRPLLGTLEAIRADCQDKTFTAAYDAMVQSCKKGEDFTEVLTDYPELCSRTSVALLKAARRSNSLAVFLPKLSGLVRAKVEGEFDPRQRFFETWALFVEAGFTVEESLNEMRHDFNRGPLGEVAEGLRGASLAGKSLAEGATRFPEVFGATALDLLKYGESRDLGRALNAITQLI